MPICTRCGTIGGYHRGWCAGAPVSAEHVNRIRYPSPNVVGLSARRAA